MTYEFENANLVGVGVFDNVTDYLVQFRGIVSDSAALTVTLDAGDNTIVLAFDQDALVADIPDADTTTRGILETATNAEALAKAATNKILTPSNLAVLTASDTFAGFVELATDAETQAGVSTTLAVTPAGLASTIVLSNTVTWADSVARLAATPSFDGQFGVQLDTNIPYFSDGSVVGDFVMPIMTLNSNNNVLTATTSLYLGANPFNFEGDSSASAVVFRNLDTFVITTSSLVSFDQTLVEFSDSLVNFASNAQVQSAGVTVPANSVLITGINPGQFSSALRTTFLSTANTQTGWATPTGTLDRGAFAAYNGQTISNPPTQAEVQALDDAVVLASQHLAALITDLKAVLLPAT